MRASSTALKERLVRAVADCQPLREAAHRYGVAVTTVKRAVVQARATSSLERKHRFSDFESTMGYKTDFALTFAHARGYYSPD